ncbi:hypothetical protein CR513_10464, partial [Mucuna pruriens]
MEIRGVISLETTIGVGSNAKTITMKFTVINTRTSYNIILGHLALNRLRAISSIAHLYMKYPVGGQVHFLDLDPRLDQEDIRPQPREDLKDVQIGLGPRPIIRQNLGDPLMCDESQLFDARKTTKNELINVKVEEQLIRVLTKN